MEEGLVVHGIYAIFYHVGMMQSGRTAQLRISYMRY